MYNQMNDETMKAFEGSVKIGLVAVTDEEGFPHISVLSTLQGKDPSTMMFGKFVEGSSKDFLIRRPKAGFLIMNPQKEFWYGSMEQDHVRKEGEDFVMYNNQPLYRYNTYFGINTVYYLKLREISDKNTLPMGEIIKNALLVLLTKNRIGKMGKKTVLKPWAAGFTAKLDTLKFLSFVGRDGYPKVVPIIQGQSAQSNRIVFRNVPYGELLEELQPGQKVGILAFAMTMEDILVKGAFSGFDRHGFASVAIEQVYNCMPPVHKQIYPENVNPEVVFRPEDTVVG
jgi:hypothetical protein